MKNTKFTKIFIVAIGVLIFTPAQIKAQSNNIYKKISVQQCDSLIKANETNPIFVILDVRTPDSWKSDHIEGSINRNYFDSDFDAQLAALPRNKIYLVHCQSGARSAGTVQKMKNLAFKEIYEMNGGISAWKNALYPTTSKISPNLMLVNYHEISLGNLTDTLEITVTNRGNDSLRFSSIIFSDLHELQTNFDSDLKLAGAEDYIFSVYHSPGYVDTDSTNIIIDSNGGELEINIVLKNGIIQQIKENQIELPLIYPNPAKDIISLKDNGSPRNPEISIFTLNGQLLFKTLLDRTNSINISEIPKGIYLIQIKKERQTFTQKLIVLD